LSNKPFFVAFYSIVCERSKIHKQNSEEKYSFNLNSSKEAMKMMI
jgi:hypothetical protein